MKLKLTTIISTLLLLALIYSTGCSKSDNMSGSLVGGAWYMQSLRVLQKQGTTVVRDTTYPYPNVALTFDSSGHYTYAGGNFVSGTYIQNGTALTLTSGSSVNTCQINTLTAHNLQFQYTTSTPPYTVDYLYNFTR